jgi:hypothetical protein
MEIDAYLLAATGIMLAIIAAVYIYKALSAPKGLFRTPREHVEVKDFRRIKVK